MNLCIAKMLLPSNLSSSDFFNKLTLALGYRQNMLSLTILNIMCFTYMTLFSKFIKARALNLSLVDVHFLRNVHICMQMRGISWAPHILYVVLQRPVPTDEEALGPSGPNQSCLHSVIWHNTRSLIIADKKWESRKTSKFCFKCTEPLGFKCSLKISKYF